MAAFNAEKYLKTSIESVIGQNYVEWELLIVDDGSTDNSVEIIRHYKDARIRYFYQENKGVSAARNVGLNNMKGEYFCFLDADDSLPSGSLKARVKKLIENPQIDFMDGHVNIYDYQMKRKLNHWGPSFQGNPLDQLLEISGACFFSPTWMIRRNHKKTYRFHEGISHGEDLLFFIELTSEGGCYDFVDEVILHYRRGHSSAMSNLKGLETGYHKIYECLKNKGNFHPEKVGEFRRKARSIIFKSYAGNFKIMDALLSLKRKW